jgi:hypothetical protein
MLVAVYVIYIPVALLRSNLPLILFDVIFLVALLLTAAAGRGPRSLTIAALMLLCLITTVPSVLIGSPESTLSTFQGVRSIMYGLGVLYLSSIWMTTRERVRTFVQIILVGSIFAALYGLRQLIFGPFAFELDRLALMGAVTREYETFNRLRVPSSFGDPLAFSFMMMTGVLFFLVSRRAKMVPAALRKVTTPTVILLLIGLASSLTRAPILALVIAMLALAVMSWRWTAGRILAAMVAIVILVGGLRALDDAVSSGRAVDPSAGPAVRSANNMMIAVWTLLPDVTRSEGSEHLETLRVLSATSRMSAWREGIVFLKHNPLGGGIGPMTEGGSGLISFSPVDVGFLRYGLELGWLGLVVYVGLWLAVFVLGVKSVLRVRNRQHRSIGHALLAIWIGFVVCQGITSVTHTGILAVVVWTTAGVIMNLHLWVSGEPSEDRIRHLQRAAPQRAHPDSGRVAPGASQTARA